MYYIIEVIVQVFIVYSQYIGCCRVPEGYVASRLTMSNKVYMLQMSNNEDLKLLSKIITTVTIPQLWVHGLICLIGNDRWFQIRRG